MAQYTINFSTNASSTIRDLNRVEQEITKIIKVGRGIEVTLDTSSLQSGLNTSFRLINREIEKLERRLSKLQIGSGAFRSAAASLGFREGQRERGQLVAEPLRLRGQAQSFEQGSFVRLQKELQALQIEASQISPGTKEWVDFQRQIAQINQELTKSKQLAETIQLREELGGFAPGSLNQLEAKLTILKNKARDISPDTTQWKEVNREIQNTERLIEKRTRKPLTGGQRLGAAGGAFLYGGGLGGGIGSALGGVLGGLGGGVPGAFAGAAVGQVVDNLSRSLAGITTQASEIQRLQRGLALASVDAKDFAEAQATVAAMSSKLLMPLDQATKYFAQLRANTKEYNLSVADTAQIMEGTALAVMATGGSLDDLDGAMRAVVQILSKGGVQAEELRGQLGERFPGAVVKFAQANKMSFEELQEALENGKVGIREFINFAKKNYDDYAKFSEQLATAPEYAGQRLQIAFQELTRELGGLFGGVGASIQDTLTAAIKSITKFIQDNRAYLRQFIADWQSIVGPIVKIFGQLLGVIAKFAIEAGKVFQQLFSAIRQSVGLANIGEAKARFERAKAAIAGKERPSGNVRGGGPFREYDQAKAAFEALGGEAAFKKASAPITPPNLVFGGPGAGISIDRAAEEDKKAKEKALREQSQLNRLIQEGLKYRTELGLVGKDELSQIEARVQLAKEVLALELKNIRNTETGAIRQQMINNAIAEYQLFVAKSNDEWANTIKELDKIKLRAEEIRDKIFGQEATDRSPLQQAFADIEQEGIDAIQAIDKELELVNEKYGTRKEGGGVRALLGNLRESVLGRTQEQKALRASQRFTKDITDDLKERIREAQESGNELTTLDEIIIKLGEDWGRLSPEVRAEITSLSTQLDQLEPFAKLNASIAATRKQLKELTSVQSMVIGGAQAIGDSFGQAFRDTISGSMTAQQALASFFQSVADYFLDMASQMIAKWMQMQIIGLVGNLLAPVAGGFAGAFGSGGPNFNASVFSGPALSSGAGFGAGGAPSLSGAFSGGPGFNGAAFSGIKLFANGGMVTGPTLGLVGEGRYNEAIVPLPDGKSIPVDLGNAAGNQIVSNITVNVNNGQAQSNANGANSSELGRKLEGAVKQVIVGELRPGGLLSR